MLLVAVGALLFAEPTTALAAPTGWEVVVVGTSSPSDTDADRLDVVVKNGYIYVTVQRDTVVKLYSILGQPISSANLPAGTSRLKVPARGIYILRTETGTRRVTV